jgi:cob(I)alamin adenosyltransferase
MRAVAPLSAQQKPGVVIVYTGDGKGKTSAGLGLICRALGNGSRVAFIQFIKSWHVSEDDFFDAILPIFENRLTAHKGGLGFYNAGNLSAKGVSQKEHQQCARRTFEFARACVSEGRFDLVVCDEINNAVHDGLLTKQDLESLIATRNKTTSLCLTGRNFPTSLKDSVDIITTMQKTRHHFDDGFIANKGIDY